MGYKEDLKAAQNRLNEANKAHEAAVKKAELYEQKARKEYNKRVAGAEKMLEFVAREWDTQLGSVGRLKLFPNRVVSPNMTLALTDGTTAQVDSSGSGKSRKVFVTVTSEDGQFVEECGADQEKAAREFAASVINQSKRAKHDAELRESKMAEARAMLQQAKDDTSEIDAAVAAVQAAREDTAEIDEATRLLGEVQASATEEDLAAAKEEQHATVPVPNARVCRNVGLWDSPNFCMISTVESS